MNRRFDWLIVFVTIAVIAWLFCVVWAYAHSGYASWYGPGFHGRTTANGETYNQNAQTCAHKTHRFGTRLRVTNLRNNKSAICRVNDRGPFIRGRVVDVSYAVAKQLGMVKSGVVPVKIVVVT